SGLLLGAEFVFFFFSSRRRHTRSKRDWSSDVCSSDLPPGAAPHPARARGRARRAARRHSRAGSFEGRASSKEEEAAPPPPWTAQIGRASCRERVELSGGAGAVKKERRGYDRQW